MPFDANAGFRVTCGNEPSKRDMFRMVMIYVVVASIWILASDHMLGERFADPDQLIATGTAKGLLFVAVTAGLLMFLLNKLAIRLAQRELALTLITDQAGDALVVFDAELLVSYANPAACRMTGYQVSELRGCPAAALLPEPTRATLRTHLERLSREPFSRDEWLLLCKDGSQKVVDVTTQRLPDGRYLAIGRDLSQSREAQIQVASERRRLKTLVDAIPDAVWLKDIAGVYLAGNPVVEEYFERRESEFLGLTDHDLFPPEVADGFLTSDRQVLVARRPQTFEQFCRHPDSGERKLETTKTPVFDAEGQVIGVLGVARDITEREQTLKALRSSEEFSRAVLDSASSQVAVLDRDGCIVAVNESWRRFARERTPPPILLANTGVGISFIEVCRTSQGEHSESAMAAYQGVLGVLRGDADHFCLDCPCQSADEQRWFIMNVTPLRSDTGGAVVTYLDITEIKHAQAMRECATSQLKALAGKHVSIQEEERRLLSMEIHDQVGQMLTSLKLTLGTVQRKCTVQPDSLPHLGHAIAIVDDLLDTTRDISRRLRPPMLDDLGLIPAVRWHLSKLTIPGSVQISLDENLGGERLAPAIELACFRLVQEGVSNALRHARASEISVSFRLQSNRLELSICDDGTGFDIEETFKISESLTSLGLLGMRERVAGLDGDFQLQSRQGMGTNLTVSFPLAYSA